MIILTILNKVTYSAPSKPGSKSGSKLDGDDPMMRFPEMRFIPVALSILVMLALFTAPVAFADHKHSTGGDAAGGASDYGFYARVMAASNTNEYAITNPTSSIQLDDEAGGYGFGFGYQFTTALKLEGFYADHGIAGIKGSSGQSYSYNNRSYSFTGAGSIDIESRSYGVASILHFPVGNGLGFFGKLGYHLWETEMKVQSLTGSANVSVDGTDMIWGFGADYAVAENLNIQLGYDTYTMDDDEIVSLYLGTELLFE